MYFWIGKYGEKIRLGINFIIFISRFKIYKGVYYVLIEWYFDDRVVEIL